MHKVTKRRLSKKGKFIIFSLIIAGLFTYNKLTKTNVNLSGYKTIYDNEITIENNSCVPIDNLTDAEVYFCRNYSGNKYFCYALMFIYKDEGKNYTIYYDATDGKAYALDLNTTNIFDLIKYRRYIKNFKHMEYLETMEEDLLDNNNNQFINEGIDRENNTVTIKALRMLQASYLAENQDVYKPVSEKIYSRVSK